MAKSMQKLRRTQIDRFFEALEVPKNWLPKKGWIKEIREALGMSMQDLATHLGVIKQRVERIEKDELNGKLTIETLKKTAEAMNCEFIYFMVPKTSLQNTVEKQARLAATNIVNNVDQTMKLEKQATSKLASQSIIEEIVQELLQKNDRRIWKNK